MGKILRWKSCVWDSPSSKNYIHHFLCKYFNPSSRLIFFIPLRGWHFYPQTVLAVSWGYPSLCSECEEVLLDLPGSQWWVHGLFWIQGLEQQALQQKLWFPEIAGISRGLGSCSGLPRAQLCRSEEEKQQIKGNIKSIIILPLAVDYTSRATSLQAKLFVFQKAMSFLELISCSKQKLFIGSRDQRFAISRATGIQ